VKKMKKIIGSLFILCFVFMATGCSSNGQAMTQITASASASPQVSETPTLQGKVNNVTFQISSFNITYQNDGSSFLNLHYNGEGIITVSGDPKLVKKPYLVLVDITKKSGGEQSRLPVGLTNVIVSNGVGKFDTTDWGSEKDHMIKPVYEAKIVGYIPYNVILSDPFSSQ
jgi:predicted transcriptional regulator with HTH domain